MILACFPRFHRKYQVISVIQSAFPASRNRLFGNESRNLAQENGPLTYKYERFECFVAIYRTQMDIQRYINERIERID